MANRFPDRTKDDACPGTLQPHSAMIEDPAVQAALQPWVEMECVQLSDGRKLAQLDRLDFGRLQVVRESQTTSVQKLGHSPADFCTVSICTQGPSTRFSEHCGEADDTIFFMPEKVDFDIYIPSAGETAYIGFSQEEFLRGARALNPAFWERPPKSVVPLISRRREEFRQAVDLWLRAAQDASTRGEAEYHALLRHHLLQTVLEIATTTAEDPAPSFNERMRGFQIGRDARRFVDDRLEEDVLPTVVDLCEALGISERTLRYAFQEYVGLSPVAYLRMCRLNKVRAVLAASDPAKTTVTQVAMRHGFLHLGRFSGDYRRMFGETPSATLGR
jgi:AraC family ethanolamine operon transcriptional activator